VGGGGVASASGGGLMEAVTTTLGVDVRVVGCGTAPLSFSDYRGGSGGGATAGSGGGRRRDGVARRWGRVPQPWVVGGWRTRPSSRGGRRGVTGSSKRTSTERRDR
jgi:hypothetical protein